MKSPISASSSLPHRVVYGIHAVEELLRRDPSQISALYICQDKKIHESLTLKQMLRKAQSIGLALLEKSRIELEQLSQGGVHQGILALCGEYKYTEMDELIEHSKSQNYPALFLVLDGITDPQNLGALVRSAYVLGAQGLILSQDRSASVTASVVKTSSGATEWMPIARVPNLVRAMLMLKEAGVWLYATTLQSQQTKAPWEVDFTMPTALVMGSEGYGLRPLVQKTCDVHLHIPMQGQLQGGSLNVSACGSVLLYEVLRQRQK